MADLNFTVDVRLTDNDGRLVDAYSVVGRTHPRYNPVMLDDIVRGVKSIFERHQENDDVIAERYADEPVEAQEGPVEPQVDEPVVDQPETKEEAPVAPLAAPEPKEEDEPLPVPTKRPKKPVIRKKR